MAKGADARDDNKWTPASSWRLADALWLCG